MLGVKIRDEGIVRNKAVYLALAVTLDGGRDVLGIWIEKQEGAKFWLKVLNEFRNRGLTQILMVVGDGMKGHCQTNWMGPVEPAIEGSQTASWRHSAKAAERLSLKLPRL